MTPSDIHPQQAMIISWLFSFSPLLRHSKIVSSWSAGLDGTDTGVIHAEVAQKSQPSF